MCRGKESYYNGFREQNMLGVFINLFCAVAYFAKIIAAHTDDVGFQPFTTIKYVDYLTTCPLLVRRYPATGCIVALSDDLSTRV
eukprot:694485-Rhodomonas_salina.2